MPHGLLDGTRRQAAAGQTGAQLRLASGAVGQQVQGSVVSLLALIGSAQRRQMLGGDDVAAAQTGLGGQRQAQREGEAAIHEDVDPRPPLLSCDVCDEHGMLVADPMAIKKRGQP